MDKAKWDYVLLLVLVALLSRAIVGVELSSECSKRTPQVDKNCELSPSSFVLPAFPFDVNKLTVERSLL